MSKAKLFLSEGYYLRFDQLSRILGKVVQLSKPLLKAELSNELGMTERMFKCLANYANAMGLMKNRSYVPSDLAHVVMKDDPYFEDKGTLWFLHYLAASNRGLFVWNRMFNDILQQVPHAVERSVYLEFFSDLETHFTEKTMKNHVRHEVNSLLNAYTEQHFGRLNLILNDGTEFHAIRNQSIPNLIFLSMIAMFQERYFPHSTTIEIRFLYSEPNSPGRTCLLDEREVREKLELLHKEKWVQIESTADLDQIRILHTLSSNQIVERYYGSRYE